MKMRVISLILLSALICACGDNSTSQLGQSNEESNKQHSGDVIESSQQTYQELRESVERAQALLNSLESNEENNYTGKYLSGHSIADEQVQDTDSNNIADIVIDDSERNESVKQTDSLVEGDNLNESETITNHSVEAEDARTNSFSKIAEGTVLLDKDGYRITYEGIGYGLDERVVSVKLLVENNSPQKRVFSSEDVYVNGYASDLIFICEIEAGAKSHETMNGYDLDESAGVKTLADIESIKFHFTVYDPDKYYDYIAYDTVELKY